MVEHQELSERLDKLSAFIEKSETFALLPVSERERLVNQEAAMLRYLTILADRIAAFGPVVPLSDLEESIVLDKALRRDIDAIIQRLKPSAPENQRPGFRRSRERSTAITKLQEAVMWLGMDLKEIDAESPGLAPNPYQTSKDPGSLTIEPTADGLKL